MFAGGAAQIKCRVVWPSQFTAAARDFIDRLLCVDPSRRLGCLKNGPADVKNHPWFVGLDWRALEAKKLPAPHVPKIKSPFDDSNFGPFSLPSNPGTRHCHRRHRHRRRHRRHCHRRHRHRALARRSLRGRRRQELPAVGLPQADVHRVCRGVGRQVVVRRPRPAGLARLGRGAGE